MKLILIILTLYIFCVNCDPSCTVSDAGEYIKIIRIQGNLVCGGPWRCDKTFNERITGAVWLADKHCSVAQISGAWIEITCSCNNHWNGFDPVDNSLRVTLARPPPPPIPTPPPIVPSSPEDIPIAPSVSPHHYSSGVPVIVWVILGTIGGVCLLCCLLYLCQNHDCNCSYNNYQCCINYCNRCCNFSFSQGYSKV